MDDARGGGERDGGEIEQPIGRQYAEMVGYSITFSALLIAFNLFSRVILSRVAVQGIARRTDQVLGVVLGIVEGVLLLSALIVILHTYADANELQAFAGLGILDALRDAIESSAIGQLLENTTVPLVLLLLGPFLPTDIKSIVPTQIPGGLPFFPLPLPGLPRP